MDKRTISEVHADKVAKMRTKLVDSNSTGIRDANTLSKEITVLQERLTDLILKIAKFPVSAVRTDTCNMSFKVIKQGSSAVKYTSKARLDLVDEKRRLESQLATYKSDLNALNSLSDLDEQVRSTDNAYKRWESEVKTATEYEKLGLPTPARIPTRSTKGTNLSAIDKAKNAELSINAVLSGDLLFEFAKYFGVSSGNSRISGEQCDAYKNILSVRGLHRVPAYSILVQALDRASLEVSKSDSAKVLTFTGVLRSFVYLKRNAVMREYSKFNVPCNHITLADNSIRTECTTIIKQLEKCK